MSLSAFPVGSAAISAQAADNTGGKSNPPPKRIIIAASDPVVLPEAR